MIKGLRGNICSDCICIAVNQIADEQHYWKNKYMDSLDEQEAPHFCVYNADEVRWSLIDNRVNYADEYLKAIHAEYID